MSGLADLQGRLGGGGGEGGSFRPSRPKLDAECDPQLKPSPKTCDSPEKGGAKALLSQNDCFSPDKYAAEGVDRSIFCIGSDYPCG